MSIKEDTIFLSTTNSRYLPITVDLVHTLNTFHPEVKLCLLTVNLTTEEKSNLRNMHSNIELIEDNGEFDTFYHEKCHCAHNRTWHMPKLMSERNCNIFWLDADVHLRGDINELFDILEKDNVDFMIRAKKLQPFTCNCGMIWVKGSEQNLKILKEWEQKADELGLLYWYSDQEGLNATVQNNMHKIVYKDFPNKFNGKSNNKESVLVHMKGPKNI